MKSNKSVLWIIIVLAALAIIAIVYASMKNKSALTTTGPNGYQGSPSTTHYGNQPATAPASAASTRPNPQNVSSYFSTAIANNTGPYLTDYRHMTLYYLDGDSANGAKCTGACLTKWPVYGPSQQDGAEMLNKTWEVVEYGGQISAGQPQPSTSVTVTVIKRPDGSYQFTANGHPLYYYYKDQQPDQMLGNGVLGVWHILTVTTTH